MCSASGAEKTAAEKLKSFGDFMVSTAKTVFGETNSVFNDMKAAYGKIVANGIDQHGFTERERSALRSNAITTTAAQYRNVAGAVKAGQAGFGGGNTVTESGTTLGQNLDVANAAAAQTANELQGIDIQDFEQGRQNFFTAADAESKLPGMFSSIAPLEGQAESGLESSLKEQQSLDAKAGWWKAPVMGLVNAGLGMATGGLSNVMTGAGSFVEGAGKSLLPPAPAPKS